MFQREYDENEVDPHHGEQEDQSAPETLDLPDDLNLEDENDTQDGEDNHDDSTMEGNLTVEKTAKLGREQNQEQSFW